MGPEHVHRTTGAVPHRVHRGDGRSHRRWLPDAADAAPGHRGPAHHTGLHEEDTDVYRKDLTIESISSLTINH